MRIFEAFFGLTPAVNQTCVVTPLPRRQIVGPPPPRGDCLHDAAKYVEHLTQVELLLADILV